MLNSALPSLPKENKREKTWLYEQYYIGERDDNKIRNGYGINNWTGAKSLESYDGQFTCNTMNGHGEYRWKHYENGLTITYEGYFFNNSKHGYGLLSFPDGRTFRGLFNNNSRWGPGIQSYATMHEDVGLWRGPQLIRLAWKPSTPSITPDFMINAIGRSIVETHRRLLTTKIVVIGKSNSALDLLKECGASPMSAVKKCSKLYPKHCSDIASPLCHVSRLEQDYYKKDIYSKLEEVYDIPYIEDSQAIDNDQINTYYAWNNNNITINMMNHSYQHEDQRDNSQIDLTAILSGLRTLFKSTGKHEVDCRTLLLTCYLGYIVNVAQLINKENVNPNVSDSQGNSAVMYATCGDQADIIRFLVDAGANVDAYNDSCCTPLGVALIRYAIAVNEIPPNAALQAVIPPPVTPPIPTAEEPYVFEWNITRDQFAQPMGPVLNKSPSKTARIASSKRVKSLMSVKDQPAGKKTVVSQIKPNEQTYDSDDSLSDFKKTYSDANREFSIKVNDIFICPHVDVPYLFDVADMIMEIEALEDDPKKIPEKNPKKVSSKVIKDTIKTSKVFIGQSKERVDVSETSIEKLRVDMLSNMRLTILELLSNGAKPMLVRCPQSALVIAISCSNPDLIKHLVQFGADVNELNPRLRGYSPLDVAVSKPYTWENLEIIRTLLESGANATRGIFYDVDDSSDITVSVIRNSVPTLLHAVLARKIENENEEEIRRHLLDLLLDYNCDPTLQFKGRSAMDVAMTKNIDLFDVFVRNRKTNLNCIINASNQSILVKIFSNPYFKSIGSMERIQTLTNLLVYGADPLVSCRNGQIKYTNIFVFAKETLSEMENLPQAGSQDAKAKNKVSPDKPKNNEKLSTKSMGKMVTDDKEDYKQAIELVTDCARLVHIRWLQGKLAKSLIEIIYKYKHRHWNMILDECKNKKAIGLWITPHRGIEIWNIFNTTKKKIYTDQRVLKHFLCIVTFLAWKFYNMKTNDFTPWSKVTGIVKNLVEKDVQFLLKENKTTKIVEELPWKCSYVKPELDKAEKKFNVCFECAMPVTENKIVCNVCKLISFCSLECLTENIDRSNCHPCSNDLKNKYIPVQN